MKRTLIFCFLCIMGFTAFSQEKISQQTITRSAGMIFIKVGVNGSKPLNFMFDSGAATTVVDTKTAASIGLVTGKEGIAVSSSAGTSANYPTFIHPEYTFDSLKFGANSGLTTDLSGFTNIFGLQVDGIIGQDLLKNFIVELDLDHSTLAAYNEIPASWGNNKAENLTFVMKNGTPRVPVAININGKIVSGLYLFDTGAGGGLSCNAYFNQVNSLQAAIKNPSTTSSLDISGQKTESTIGQIDAVVFGKYSLKNPTASISVAVSPAITPDAGLLGMSIIGRFNVLFNNKAGTISLLPNQTFADPFVPLYQLGLGLSWKGGTTFVVSNLVDKSLAYQAGFRNGDVIEKVNGKAPKLMNELYQDLKKLGISDLNIDVRREDKMFRVTLKKLKS